MLTGSYQSNKLSAGQWVYLLLVVGQLNCGRIQNFKTNVLTWNTQQLYTYTEAGSVHLY